MRREPPPRRGWRRARDPAVIVVGVRPRPRCRGCAPRPRPTRDRGQDVPMRQRRAARAQAPAGDDRVARQRAGLPRRADLRAHQRLPRAWRVDIGARVTKGQLLARIAIPEVEQQLQQARSALAVARANLALPKSTRIASRRSAAQGPCRSRRSTPPSGRCGEPGDGRRQQGERAPARAAASNSRDIRAPFDGIITVRNVDVGDLINAGARLRGTELFQHRDSPTSCASTPASPRPTRRWSRRRLTAEVRSRRSPADHHGHARADREGDRSDDARPATSRSQVDNPTVELFAGGVRPGPPERSRRQDLFAIPVEALCSARRLEVATVVDGTVAMKPIMPGRDSRRADRGRRGADRRRAGHPEPERLDRRRRAGPRRAASQAPSGGLRALSPWHGRCCGRSAAMSDIIPLGGPRSDALVLFGATGDLAYKKIFPALCRRW